MNYLYQGQQIAGVSTNHHTYLGPVSLYQNAMEIQLEDLSLKLANFHQYLTDSDYLEDQKFHLDGKNSQQYCETNGMETD